MPDEPSAVNEAPATPTGAINMTDALFSGAASSETTSDTRGTDNTPAESAQSVNADAQNEGWLTAEQAGENRNGEYIPKSRFNEINEQRKQFETRNAELEAKVKDFESWSPALQDIKEKLKYADPATFQEAIASQLAREQENARQAEEKRILAEVEGYRDYVISQYGEEVGNQLAEAKRLNVLADTKMAKMQADAQLVAQNFHQAQIIGRQKQMVQEAVAAPWVPEGSRADLQKMLETVHPDYIPTAVAQFESLLRSHKNAILADYNIQKDAVASANAVLPEGPGGTTNSLAGGWGATMREARATPFWQLVEKRGAVKK